MTKINSVMFCTFFLLGLIQDLEGFLLVRHQENFQCLQSPVPPNYCRECSYGRRNTGEIHFSPRKGTLQRRSSTRITNDSTFLEAVSDSESPLPTRENASPKKKVKTAVKNLQSSKAPKKAKRSKSTASSKKSNNGTEKSVDRNNVNNPKRSKSQNSYANSSPHKKLNQKIVQAESGSELLSLLQQTSKALTATAGGGSMNSVNFSTSLHRLARRSTNGRSDRAAILADPRFALLLSSLSEALLDTSNKHLSFNSREVSNIGWALAKLKIAPPSSAMPLPRYQQSSKSTAKAKDIEALISDNRKNMQTSSNAIREKVLQAAAHRQKNGNVDAEVLASTWIPHLSQLAGHILDYIGVLIVEESVSIDGGQRENKHPFQMQEMANLLWAWATASRADSTVYGIVVRKMIQQEKEKMMNGEKDLHPQEWSNSMWAFATSQVYDGHEELLIFLSELLEDNEEFIDQFKSQELSNTVWGVATLLSNKEGGGQDQFTIAEQSAALKIVRKVAGSLVRRRASGFRTQELSNTLWALATVGFGLKPSAEQATNNYVVLVSDREKEDYQLMRKALDAVVEAALSQLKMFRSQELNNLTWALARLVDEKSDNMITLLRGIGMQFSDQHRRVTSQDIGTTLWGFATLEFFDEGIYRAVAARITPSRGPTYKPQELSNTLWAFATAEIQVDEIDAFDTSLVPSKLRPTPQDPVTICFATAAQELMRRPHQFKSQEIKDVLWSFSKVGIRHPKLFKAAAEHLVGDESSSQHARGLDEFSPQGLGNAAWAFARQAQLAEEVSYRLKGATALANISGRLAVYTTSYFDLSERLLQRFFSAIAEAEVRVHDELRRCKPQDIANTAWAFAVLGLKDTRFTEAVKSELMSRMNRLVRGEMNSMTLFKGQELANILWALATLNVPAGNSLDSLASYLHELCKDHVTGKVTTVNVARFFKRQELANMAWACSVFGKYPNDLMRLIYMGLVGLDKEQDPAYMSRIHGDGGLQLQAIMTLVYVQAAMDLEGLNQRLNLPEGFPDGWQQSSTMHNEHDGDLLIDKSFELNLTTSKIQRAVSAAFSRIGFHHEEELTITMEEMARIYGINVPPKQMEILSIDIANVEERIAVEVDGPAHFVSRIEETAKMPSGYSKLLNGKTEYQFGWNGDFQESNGATHLKERLLQSFGWKIIHVPFWEWYALEGDAAKEEKYCRDVLNKQAGV